MTDKKREVIYYQLTDLWRRLCEMHTTLLDYTCEEYSLLLQSEIEKLEETVKKKDALIGEINSLEKVRAELIESARNEFGTKIEKIKDLLELMHEFESKNDQKHLFRFNNLLIDIIEKIQDQNKKNQMFINRALLSLKEIREEASGQKNYSTYTAYGETTMNTKGSV